jgi:MFS family permease
MNDDETSTGERIAKTGKTKGRPWIFFLFFVALTTAELTFFTLTTITSTTAGMVLEALIFSKVAIAGILGGLLGRNWLTGILWVSLSFMSLVAVVIALSLSGVSQVSIVATNTGWDTLWIVCILPLVVLELSFVFLLARSVGGYRLTVSEDQKSFRGSKRIEDLLLVTTSLAVILSFVSLPVFAMSRGFPIWNLIRFLPIGLILGLAGFPFLFVAFRIRRFWNRVIGYTLATLFGSFVVMSVLYLMGASLENTGYVAIIIGFVLGMYLEVLLLSGLHLVRYESKDEYLKRLEIAVENEQLHKDRRMHRLQTAGLLVAVLVAYMGAGFRDQARSRTDDELGTLATELRSRDGSLEIVEGNVTKLKLSPSSTNEDVKGYLKFRDLTELDLSGSQVTDEVVAIVSQFPKLKSLDLSNTAITDQGIELIVSTLQLDHISVANTGISTQSILKLIGPINSVDLGSLNLTDEDMASIPVNARTLQRSLSLRGNREITDVWLGGLGPIVCFHNLDLSDMSICGNTFSPTLKTMKLVLHNCPLTDASFLPNLAKLSIDRDLQLAETQLTNACLQPLIDAVSIRGLSLGDGNFTEEGLASLVRGHKTKLGLNGKQFTGVCFAQWKPQINYLDMSHSSVSDETMSHVQAVTGMHWLRLSHTQISDVGLEIITNPMIQHIDVSHTKVTVEGLLKLPPTTITLIIAPGQFTSKELKRLRSRFSVTFDSSRMW